MRKGMGLFRGKRVDNGEWVFGSLAIDSSTGTPYIVGEFLGDYDGWMQEEVDPETVGQSPDGKYFEGDLFEQASGIQELIYDEHFCKFALRTVEPNEFGFCEILPYAPHTLALNKIGTVHDKEQP